MRHNSNLLSNLHYSSQMVSTSNHLRHQIRAPDLMTEVEAEPPKARENTKKSLGKTILQFSFFCLFLVKYRNFWLFFP
jgi:hypothetical protein